MKKVDTTTPQEQSTPQTRKPANQLLREFLDANDMVLKLTPITERMSRVDDGSILIKPSEVVASYRGE